MINNPSVVNAVNDHQTVLDRLSGTFDTCKRAAMDATEIAADHDLVAFGKQVIDDDLVIRERRLDIGYVFGQAFVGDKLPNEVRRLRPAAQSAKIIGD